MEPVPYVFPSSVSQRKVNERHFASLKNIPESLNETERVSGATLRAMSRLNQSTTAGTST